MIAILNMKHFCGLLFITIVIMISMQSIDSHLVTSAAPNGIVSFEFAGNLENSQMILASWSGSAMFYAGLSMGLDFLFLIAYSITLTLGCLLLGKKLGTRWQAIGNWVAGGIVAAAGLDLVENLALVNLLTGSSKLIFPPLAAWCAGLKFGLVAIGLSYILIGLASISWRRIRA